MAPLSTRPKALAALHSAGKTGLNAAQLSKRIHVSESAARGVLSYLYRTGRCDKYIQGYMYYRLKEYS